jgi:hypothetical protein
MTNIDFKSLTPQEKQALIEQVEAEKQQQKEAERKLREEYNQLKEELIAPTFQRLNQASNFLKEEKKNIFNDFKALLELKQDLYGLSDQDMEFQQSHTFTNSTNTCKIIIGSNVIDGWTDDVSVGVEGVKRWVMENVSSKDRGFMLALLKPNKDGVLTASRVLDLSAEANKTGDQELIKHVDFIRDQYRPQKTSTYVKAKYLDTDGKWQWLALSMSAV